jgi:cytochrome c biogenesis protein CcmG/thiol:disulfide interchange protein DsbE
MARPVKILMVVLLLGALLGAAACGSATGSAGAAVIGSPAPDFTLQTPDGQTFSLSDLKGHPVMVNFWATWCDYCKLEMPFLDAVAVDTARVDGGLKVVAVDVQESADAVRSFQQTHDMPFQVVLDAKGQVANLYNVKGLPTTYFIDKDGIIKYVKVGALASQKDIDTILDKTIMKE